MATPGDPQFVLTTTTDTLFEAPNSAEVQPLRDKDRKFYSIDFSLELERQLEMETTPVTPSFPLPSAMRDETPLTTDAQLQQEKVDATLDPEILAHLITQLRNSLAEMTKERDELSRLLSESLNKEANLNDALQLMTEKATSMNEELDIAKRKAREDEEAIALLRTKVEESRRGLMQLQKESRRQSMAPIDVNRASLLTAFTPSSSSQGINKRASTFTPLTGRPNSHRRISSVSGVVDFSMSDTPNGQNLTFPDGVSSTSPPPTASRPMFVGRQPSPGRPDGPSSPPRDSASAELATLRMEVQNLQNELQTAKHDLAETTEAREASENCVRALRQFIAESCAGDSASSTGSGLGSGIPLAMKLPPPPTMTNGSEDGDGIDTASITSMESKKAAGGWGFKLWGSNSGSIESPKPPVSAAPPQSAPAWGSPQLGGSTSAPPPVSAAQPLSKKLGGFFSSRSASVSSTSTTSSAAGSTQPGLPTLDTIHQASANPNAAPSHTLMMGRHTSRETNSSIASDGSSISYVEPLSPGDDIHGLGHGYEYGQAPPVLVRGETDGEMDLMEEVDMGKTPGVPTPPMGKGIPAADIGIAR